MATSQWMKSIFWISIPIKNKIHAFTCEGGYGVNPQHYCMALKDIVPELDNILVDDDGKDVVL